MGKMKIALAQINTKVGDLDNNLDLIINYIEKAKYNNADLVVFPELSITGYPPRDLLDYDYFVQDNLEKLEKLKKYSANIGIICGYIDINPNPYGRKYCNAAALIYNNKIIHRHYKCLLPFYDVFDETRYFEPGHEVEPVEFMGKKIGITICEDIWNDKDYWKRLPYDFNPIDSLAQKNVDMIINISASPYWLNKGEDRIKILQNIIKKYHIPLVYLNQTGGNDDLIFDGVSFALDKNGELLARCTDFQEDLIFCDFDENKGEIKKISQSEEENLFNALKLGLFDYCKKSGFDRVIIGLSGGIDWL